ncbi:hypothetical protein RclHR1_06850007 [Rhizophagus clarus]|uniref:Myb-like DNA-binding domain containing protein n=1 Tax=Rhizophagus clarus TaxID=94130 RepID=A0A2Z6SJZ8_9GLOM|nr:hypothetical protein RclHR1_06850007 [Rhizophagus clarus]GES89056.1 Myb-like DNA-binding domain containing protein [Rhizophagus clarus]
MSSSNILQTSEEVGELDTEGLITLLRGRQNLHLNETHYNVLRYKEIAGSDFLSYTKEDFESFGLAPGPAKRIEQLVNELNNQNLVILNPWSSTEDIRLITAVRRFGTRSWSRVAHEMGNRNSIECQTRWRLIDFNANRPNRTSTRNLYLIRRRRRNALNANQRRTTQSRNTNRTLPSILLNSAHVAQNTNHNDRDVRMSLEYVLNTDTS